jgi:hypothetical protein
MKLGGVNTFTQGMLLEKRRRSLGMTGCVWSVTRGMASRSSSTRLWIGGATGLSPGTVPRQATAVVQRLDAGRVRSLLTRRVRSFKIVSGPLWIEIGCAGLVSPVTWSASPIRWWQARESSHWRPMAISIWTGHVATWERPDAPDRTRPVQHNSASGQCVEKGLSGQRVCDLLGLYK